MKISAIKYLVENRTIEDLMNAEEALLEEAQLPFDIEGDDDGEKLTHIFAALWILKKMKEDSLDFKLALREYTKKVRESIN